MSVSDSSAPAVEVRELVREFKGGIRAVDGLDLEVAAGEIYAFLGPNGPARRPSSASSRRCCGRPPAPRGRGPRRRRARRRGPAIDRRRAPGGRDRPADDRARAAADAGRAARAARGGARARGLAARARRPDAGRRPARRRLLGRDAAAARPRARARAPADRAVPRRADHRPGPDEPWRPLARGPVAQRRGHDGLPDDPVPRGGRAARRSRRHHRRGRWSPRARRTC